MCVPHISLPRIDAVAECDLLSVHRPPVSQGSGDVSVAGASSSLPITGSVIGSGTVRDGDCPGVVGRVDSLATSVGQGYHSELRVALLPSALLQSFMWKTTSAKLVKSCRAPLT